MVAGILWVTEAHSGSFNHLATWPVFHNLAADEDPNTETAAEILAATGDGRTLLYADARLGAIGFVDIADPARPAPGGRVTLAGSPTSVVVVGRTALVAVVTSASPAEPAGHVAVIDLARRVILGRCDVHGQPDAVAVSPDHRYLAVAVENQRDEDHEEGRLPQPPPGHLAVFDLGEDGRPLNCDGVRLVQLTGIADVAPDDPEPEYVAINEANVAAVTLQENNHIALVDLRTGTLVGHFPAGTVDLEQVDTRTDGTLSATGSLHRLAREPDAVVWLDSQRLVLANEGDYAGGGRGISMFERTGRLLFDSGAALEHLALRLGHYPEKRASDRGVEPEGLAHGTFGGERFIFVGLERADLVAVYRDGGPGQRPTLHQALPTGTSPEGILALPGRGLLAVANEEDKPKKGARSTITLYAYGNAAPAYPMLVAGLDPAAGSVPIGWGAISGLAAHRSDPGVLFAVHDDTYAYSRIWTIDASVRPMRIVAQQPLEKAGKPVSYNLKGVAAAEDGGFWLVSEDRKGAANLLIRVEFGTVRREVILPPAIAQHARRIGFKGVASIGRDAEERVYVAMEGRWKKDAKGYARIGVYRPADGSWGFFHYPFEGRKRADGRRVEMTEIAALDRDHLLILESDNRQGHDAKIKRVYLVSIAGRNPAPIGRPPVRLEKRSAFDLLPKLAAASVWAPQRVDGLTVAANGSVYVVTNNRGLRGTIGETMFLEFGDKLTIFGRLSE